MATTKKQYGDKPWLKRYSTGYAGQPYQWELWIKPTRPEHYDEANNWVGPWGVTYFTDFEEAREFIIMVQQAIKEGTLVY